MAINIVQVATGTVTVSAGVGGTLGTITATFSAALATGNTVLVLLGEDNQGLIASISLGTLSDAEGNTYAIAYQHWQPGSSGPGGALASATNIVGGATSVSIPITATSAIGTASVRFSALCIELSGAPSASIVSYVEHSVFGSEGNTPVTKSLTDSFGNTVSVTFGGGAGSGGPGTSCGLNAFDLVSSGANFLCAWVVNGSPNTPTADHGYSFTLSENVAPAATFHFYTPGLPFATVQQPQIFAVN